QATVTPLRALLKALVESVRKVKGDGMGCHSSDSCAAAWRLRKNPSTAGRRGAAAHSGGRDSPWRASVLAWQWPYEERTRNEPMALRDPARRKGSPVLG